MFLKILWLKTDGSITAWLKRKYKSFDNTTAPVNDLSGSNPTPNKVNPDRIITYINSFKPAISYYTRQNAPNRQYLNPNLNVTDLYAHFK